MIRKLFKYQLPVNIKMEYISCERRNKKKDKKKRNKKYPYKHLGILRCVNFKKSVCDSY